MKKLFFDTYALIELIKGNSAYARYSDDNVLTSQFNLVELYYSLISDFDKELAKKLYLKFKGCVHTITDEVIFEAMELKKMHKKMRLSYVDCIGYVCAKQNNVKFLTGDKQFQSMSNVEYVK